MAVCFDYVLSMAIFNIDISQSIIALCLGICLGVVGYLNWTSLRISETVKKCENRLTRVKVAYKSIVSCSFSETQNYLTRPQRACRPFSGGSRIFARGVRQLVPLECPKPLHALSPSDP